MVVICISSRSCVARNFFDAAVVLATIAVVYLIYRHDELFLLVYPFWNDMEKLRARACQSILGGFGVCVFFFVILFWFSENNADFIGNTICCSSCAETFIGVLSITVVATQCDMELLYHACSSANEDSCYTSVLLVSHVEWRFVTPICSSSVFLLCQREKCVSGTAVYMHACKGVLFFKSITCAAMTLDPRVLHAYDIKVHN